MLITTFYICTLLTAQLCPKWTGKKAFLSTIQGLNCHTERSENEAFNAAFNLEYIWEKRSRLSYNYIPLLHFVKVHPFRPIYDFTAPQTPLSKPWQSPTGTEDIIVEISGKHCLMRLLAQIISTYIFFLTIMYIAESLSIVLSAKPIGKAFYSCRTAATIRWLIFRLKKTQCILILTKRVPWSFSCEFVNLFIHSSIHPSSTVYPVQGCGGAAAYPSIIRQRWGTP